MRFMSQSTAAASASISMRRGTILSGTNERSEPRRQAQARLFQPVKKLLRTRDSAKRNHRPIDLRHVHATPQTPHLSLPAASIHPFRNLGFVFRDGNDVRPLRCMQCFAQIAGRKQMIGEIPAA